jgi:bifunctional non-homologous end joining protein LigD
MVKGSKRVSRQSATPKERQLAKYRAKRNFKITPEPSGARSRGPKGGKRHELTYVIQKHAASRLHYDFRLEWDGVLKSWAVAKGPSYYPGDKRLAVQVEDHPLDYGGFEGIIPKGEYGGGTVMVWDRGTWEPIGNAADGLRNGNLKFELHGKKLHGRWVLVRMGGRFANESKPNWLLIKERDGKERSASEPPVTEAQPNSVLSRRGIEAIAKAKDAVWSSNDASPNHNHSGQSKHAEQNAPGPTRTTSRRNRVGPARPPKRVKHETPRHISKRLNQAPKEALPSFVAPQLASTARFSPEGKDWLHELKHDGYRIEARVRSGAAPRAALLTRTSLDWTHRMPSIAEAVAALPVRSALLDGEVVVLARDGTTSFANLQAAFQESTRYPLTYFVFDLLHLDGHNLRNLPLLERKEILSELLSRLPLDGPIRISEHMAGDGQSIFEKACKLGAEGIISKLARGKYVSGRGNGWLKHKCYREQEFVIGGFTVPSNGIRGVGALLLGYYEGDRLIYAGRTGTGFTQKTHKMMRARLETLRSKTNPFKTVPSLMSRGVQWVKPELVAQVAFSTWTTDNLVRQAAFKGLRADKPAHSVHREEEKMVPTQAKNTGTSRKLSHGKGKTRAKAVSRNDGPEVLPIRLTHPEKVLDASSGLTKKDLARYYLAVAPSMLPHIADRPLMIMRCQSGSGKPCFFQKHVNESLPPDIQSVKIVDKKSGKTEPYITLSSREALAELAQLSVMEIHCWGSKNESLEKPDRIVIDLDPDVDIDWKTLAATASEVRSRMESAGLKAFLKTTGGKGLHIVAPVRPEQGWPEVKDFAHRMVLAMEKDNPSLYLTRMTKAARKGKIYLDYLRNERGATSIAPFSPRAREGTPVALPLDWSELKLPKRPIFYVSEFHNWEDRLAHDPWAAMSRAASRLKF